MDLRMQVRKGGSLLVSDLNIRHYLFYLEGAAITKHAVFNYGHWIIFCHKTPVTHRQTSRRITAGYLIWKMWKNVE